MQTMLLSSNIQSLCKIGLILMAAAISLQVGSAQDNPGIQDATHKQDGASASTGAASPQASNSSGPESSVQKDSPAPLLGPGDELEITVYGAPDLSGHTRVTADGNISMPLVGFVRIEGLTESEAEGAIEAQLRANNIVNDPRVSVYVKEYTHDSISVTGEVARPGAYSPVGRHRLFDILQAAGGLTEKASNRAVISHRGSEKLVMVDIPNDPAKRALINAEILPGDTVVVPPAPIIYMLGEVNKPGGYVLNSINGMTLLRILAAAGGPTHEAAVGSTKMLRNTPSGLKELSVPLKDILKAKVSDMPVQAEDIIYVPRSRLKASLIPGALLNTAAAVALYRIP